MFFLRSALQTQQLGPVADLVADGVEQLGARPMIYAGGESEAAKTMIAEQCDAYVMHGDSVEAIGGKISDMKRRRDATGHGPMQFGMAAYAIVRDSEPEARAEQARITAMPATPPKGFDNFEQWLSGTQLERDIKLRDYSVSNRGLMPDLVGTPAQVRDKIAAYEAVGIDLLLLQMSPQAEEMDRFAETIIAPMRVTST